MKNGFDNKGYCGLRVADGYIKLCQCIAKYIR